MRDRLAIGSADNTVDDDTITTVGAEAIVEAMVDRVAGATEDTLDNDVVL